MLIDGPSPEHELVLQGRLEGQAPDIDPVVYLTDCDPAAYRAGRPHPCARSSARRATTCSSRPIRLTTSADRRLGRRLLTGDILIWCASCEWQFE